MSLHRFFKLWRNVIKWTKNYNKQLFSWYIFLSFAVYFLFFKLSVMLKCSMDFVIVFCFLVKPQNGFTVVCVNSYWIPIVRIQFTTKLSKKKKGISVLNKVYNLGLGLLIKFDKRIILEIVCLLPQQSKILRSPFVRWFFIWGPIKRGLFPIPRGK